MRIALVHNDAAGDAVPVARLGRAIARHGHDIVAVTHPSTGLAGLGGLRLDLVAIAGGDGTVAATAFALADTGATIPMAVLPTGTANNTARTLGVPADPDDAITAWSTSVMRPLDLGRATGPWGERRFLESVGGGLVTHGIVVMDRRDYVSATTEAQLERGRRTFADVLALLEPTRWTLTIDGAPIDDRFLLVEVLNVGSVGPNLRLSDGLPSDGELTVVAAPEQARDQLLSALSDGDGTSPAGGLLAWQAREVVITASDRLHVDDEVMEGAADIPVRVTVDAGALAVLCPPR